VNERNKTYKSEYIDSSAPSVKDVILQNREEVKKKLEAIPTVKDLGTLFAGLHLPEGQDHITTDILNKFYESAEVRETYKKHLNECKYCQITAHTGHQL
jgi:hypothetical protein